MNPETKLHYYTKKNKENKGEESLIEEVFPLGKEFLCLKLSGNEAIYTFIRVFTSKA